MSRKVWIHAVAVAALVFMGAQAASAKYLYSYAVKFVCGYNNNNLGYVTGPWPWSWNRAGEPSVKFGNYATEINIYNFNVDTTQPTDAIIGKDVILLVDRGVPVGREPRKVRATFSDSITLVSQ